MPRAYFAGGAGLALGAGEGEAAGAGAALPAVAGGGLGVLPTMDYVGLAGAGDTGDRRLGRTPS